MLHYPKIAGSRNAPGGRCVAFEKYDGTNLHWDWDRRRWSIRALDSSSWIDPMAKTVPPARMDEAIHVVPNDSAAGALHYCGVRDLVVIQDRMCPGPCDADPDLHLAKRQEHLVALAQGYSGPNAGKFESFWTWMAGNLLGAREFNAKLSEFPSERPVVLWTAACWSDRLVYWWVFDALQRSPQNWSRFWVAEPPQPQGDARIFYHTQSQLAYRPPEEYRATFAGSRRLRMVEVKAGAALWGRFASASPLEFDKVRRRGSRPFPDLREDAEVYGNFFPQAAAGRIVKLRLSAADQELMDALRTDQWLSPRELEGRSSRLVSCFSATGIHSRLRRLRDWAGHALDDPAVIAGPGPEEADEFNAVAYRLTRRGARLRKHGLESAEEAPPMFVGGCRLYAGEPLWVRRNRGDGWVIDAIAGQS